MKKILAIVVALLVVVALCCGCNRAIGVSEVAPYVFETETYTELDYDYADDYYAKTYDNWGGGCSAVAKTLADGTTIVGRNMDLNISNKCAYVVRTAVPNKYKTIGLAYTFRDISPDYADVQKSGLSTEFSKLLPFMCDDVMNEKGLYIEINMRNGEFWPGGQDKFACKGTNKFSNQRIYMFELPRYIGENCATVEEAIQFVKTVNVYSKEGYWNYCFMLADASGAYGLLEFAMDNVLWRPGEVGQTNYYIDEYVSILQDTKTGEGRLAVLKEGLPSVQTKKDMFELMDSVTYFQFYDAYNCKFDPRSENIGCFAGATYDVLMAEENREYVMAALENYGKPIRELSRQQLRDANEYWESTFTEVADCNEKSIFVRFYQDDNLKFKLTFDGFYRAEL